MIDGRHGRDRQAGGLLGRQPQEDFLRGPPNNKIPVVPMTRDALSKARLSHLQS